MKVVNRPIEMISVTSMEGEVTPIRFKMKNKQGELGVYPITEMKEVIKTPDYGSSMMKYRYMTIVNGIDTYCEIQYNPSTCRWRMHKI